MAIPGYGAPWPVQTAKAKMSEVLRRAREEGPQLIGTTQPGVVVSLPEWEELNRAREPLGAWLVGTAPRLAELWLPDRAAPDRPLDLA